MTDREKAIVMAYTGKAMLTGEKLSIFHKYIEDILGRPIWTHELAFRSVWDEIEEKSKGDFIELCKNTENKGEWIEDDNHNIVCPFCGGIRRDCRIDHINFCNRCGADLRKPNCVTCDHFGDCEGCERSDEE